VLLAENRNQTLKLRGSRGRCSGSVAIEEEEEEEGSDLPFRPEHRGDERALSWVGEVNRTDGLATTRSVCYGQTDEADLKPTDRATTSPPSPVRPTSSFFLRVYVPRVYAVCRVAVYTYTHSVASPTVTSSFSPCVFLSLFFGHHTPRRARRNPLGPSLVLDGVGADYPVDVPSVPCVPRPVAPRCRTIPVFPVHRHCCQSRFALRPLSPIAQAKV